MLKTVMKPTLVFDKSIVKVGNKIKFEYYYPDGSVYDWGCGEVLTVEDDELGIDYYSEIDISYDIRMVANKEYHQLTLSPEELKNKVYSIELM